MNIHSVAAGLLLGCSGAVAATITTGIRGVVNMSPSHPGPQRIGDSGHAGYAGAKLQVRDAHERVVGQAVADAEGRFVVAVPPGEYSVEVDVGEAILPRCGTAQASVRDGQLADVAIDCDSGMR